MGTKFSAEYFGGLIWPGRFIGFGLGMMSFAILTYLLMNETMTVKTWLSIGLALILVCIQIFWK